MKIVVLDAYTLNPGDLSWDELRKIGEVDIFDRTSHGETAHRIAHAQLVLTNKTVLTREHLDGAKHLRYIGVMATGYNVVDVEAAREKGITVTNVPAYSTASVAQLAFAFILHFATKLSQYTQSVARGDWAVSKDFTYMLEPVIELQGKVLGIVGFGQTGQALARIGQAFGMRIIVSHTHPDRDRMAGVEFVQLEDVFRDADFISLHLPLRKENERFVNASLLQLMKPQAYLINTSRGGLIEENDLANALNSDQIAGAGLDVLSEEPPSNLNPLLHAKNACITPHIAWASKEARLRLMDVLIQNIQSFLKGRPQNTVR